MAEFANCRVPWYLIAIYRQESPYKQDEIEPDNVICVKSAQHAQTKELHVDNILSALQETWSGGDGGR